MAKEKETLINKINSNNNTNKMVAKITIYLKEDFKTKHLEEIVNKIRLYLGSYIKDLKVSDEVKEKNNEIK